MEDKKRSKVHSLTVMALLAVFVAAVVVVVLNKAKPGSLAALKRSLTEGAEGDDFDLDAEID